MLKRIFRPPDEHGQGLVEYALILSLVALIIIVILTAYGGSVRNIYCDIVTQLAPYFGFSVPSACT